MAPKLAAYSRQGVRDIAISSKELVVIYKDSVLNVTKWAKHHPGGLLPLKHLNGQDATDHILAFHPAHVIEKKLPAFVIGKLAADYVEISKASAAWRKLNQKLTDQGLYETRMSFYYLEFAKITALFALTWGLVLYSDSFAVHMMSALLLASVWQQGAFVAHDAGHSGITHDKNTDNIIGMMLGNLIGGISIGWWKATHNVHHIVTNHVEHDCDIQHVPFIACSPLFLQNVYSSFHNRIIDFQNCAIARFIIPIQHFTYIFALMFGRVNLYVQSFIYLANGSTMAPQAMRKWDHYEFTLLLCFWTWYSTLLSQLPNWPTMVAYVLLSNGGAFILHLQITISHFGLPCDDFPLLAPDAASNPLQDFSVRNLSGTMDVDCPIWMDWFHGGLQYQVTHHLFPRLPRHHLRHVRVMAMEYAKECGLVYNHYPFVEANGLVLGKLKEVAMQARIYLKVAQSLK